MDDSTTDITSSTNSFDLVEHPEQQSTIDLVPDDEDAAISAILLDSSISEGEKISAISLVRGNFSGDISTIEEYMSENISAQTAVDRLAAPIDEAYSTADHGRQFYKAEHAARHQRTFHAPNKAAEKWGVEQDIREPGPSTADLPTAEGSLWTLWFGVLHKAKMIPWQDDATQGRLVELVTYFKLRPNPPLPQPMTVPLRRNWIWSDGTLWSTLSMLGPSARETWNDSCGCGSGWTVPEQHGWMNVNAFAARLTVAKLHDFTLYATWALRDALEEQIEGATDHKKTDAVTKSSLLITVACIWIIIAGDYMYKKAEDMASGDLVSTELRGKKLPWNGAQQSEGISTARWDFWRRRLLEESNRAKLPEHVRSLAAERSHKISTFQNATRSGGSRKEDAIPNIPSRLLSDW